MTHEHVVLTRDETGRWRASVGNVNGYADDPVTAVCRLAELLAARLDEARHLHAV